MHAQNWDAPHCSVARALATQNEVPKEASTGGITACGEDLSIDCGVLAGRPEIPSAPR